MRSDMYVLSAGLEYFFAAISVILLIGCSFDHERKRRVGRIMIVILAVNALMNALDGCIWLWCEVPSVRELMKGLSFLSYGLGCSIFVLFSTLVISYIREYAHVPRWISRCVIALGALMALLWALSLFNDSIYYWDENGSCLPGPLYPISQIFGIVFLIANVVLVLVYRRVLPQKDSVVLILYNAIPLVSYVFTPLWDIVPLYMASTLALLLYYIIIHVEHGARMAQQETRLARQALELADSRTAIMLSQIQPHFLYNTLTAIAQLCQKDPLMAKETTIRFSEYLRENMHALTQTEPIPFERELKHVETYLAIERVRFGEALRIKWDITATDFAIPPLCLQSIVENAVKHGVGMAEEGGTVIINTVEYPNVWQITVFDDGAGFDPGCVPNDGKTHIGIQNARERLKSIGADLLVESKIGYGTRVTIQIPKKEAV